ncbi:MAG: hypothetical protein HRU19_18945 [Pseudobacteriovorax sp.]|nr:hypothetical protein [Pseudobacteriovorax sp.]
MKKTINETQKNQATKTQSNLDKKEKRALHLSLYNLKRFKTIQDQANQKQFGKKLSLEDVATAVLDFVDVNRVVTKLKDESLRPEDHVKAIYQDYCKKNERISFDAFILKVLVKEIQIDFDLETLKKGVM